MTYQNLIYKFQTTIKIEVLGYVFGAGVNQDQPKVVIRENAVEVRIQRERVILGDELEHKRGKIYGSTKTPEFPE